MGRKHLAPLVVAILSSWGAGAHAASVPNIEFDFQYGIAGPAQVQPVQVFDNGTETFFRFKDDIQAVPTILAETARGLVATRNFRSGPFVVVAGVAGSYRLTLGPLEASVTYAGSSPLRDPASQAKPAAVEPPRVAAAVPSTPAPATAATPGASAPVPVVQPASAPSSAGNAVAATSSSPTTAPGAVPAGATVAATGADAVPAAAPATPPAQSWRLERGVALHTQLHQWAAAAGWTLEWKPSRSWVVPAEARFEGSFDQAIEKVVRTLTDEGKPVRLILWEGNHVAEISEVAR